MGALLAAARHILASRKSGGHMLAGALLAASLAFAPPAARAQGWAGEQWTGAWGAGPAGPPLPANTQMFTGQTVRLIVHASIGGNRVRVRLSNEMGAVPLHIGAAQVAVRASGAEIMPGTGRALTFGGAGAVTLAPGAPALSDPVELNVAPLSDLAISIYLPGTVGATTVHSLAGQTSYVSLPGDFTGAASLPVQRTMLSQPFVTQVDIDSGGAAAIVALGDSITDGMRSTPDTNNRWPDWLARRLQAAREGRLGVINRGISGNRLLSDPPAGSLAGRSALTRFGRDVLAVPGVRYLAVLIGINDIGHSPNGNPVAATELVAGYRQLIARAHEHGIAVFGATLTPFEGAGYYSPSKERVRQAVNEWIRGGGEFDGVIDFDAVIRDPARPGRLLPAYDSGDHLHPNDLGYQTMGNAVPLTLFRPPGLVQ